MVNDWLRHARDWLLPSSCLLCGGGAEEGLELCSACTADLPRNSPGCRRCALPLPGITEDRLCGRCLQSPPPFERVLSPFLYRPPLDHLIHALKFRRRLPAARLLGTHLADWVEARLTTPPELIVPVPLHSGRLFERGFNQALELARPVARRLGITVEPGLCRRLRPAARQSSLRAAARRDNVRGAFSVAGRLDARHVAIVDDVLTTGQTAGELTRVLRQAGAERVEVWVCARAV